jgi:hypothetical protein
MTYTAEQLTTMLRAGAGDSHTSAAAVDLLAQSEWLHRADFARHILIDEDGMARIRWTEAVATLDAGELPASGGEGRLLRIAASLGGGVPVDLRSAVRGLGCVCVVEAAMRTAGAFGCRNCRWP